MSSPRPPIASTPADDALVRRVLTLLLSRLARSPEFPSTLPPPDRAVFASSLEARRAVLERGAAWLVAGFAVYRAALAKAPAPVRGAFGLLVVSTALGGAVRGAKAVSEGMVADILNLGVDSPLGNEARIVLGDAEGPDGPLYNRVVGEALRREIVERRQGGDVHPQMALTPRLVEDGVAGVLEGRSRADAGVWERVRERRARGEGRTVVGRGQRRKEEDEDEDATWDPLEPLEALDGGWEERGAPVFDFATAAKGRDHFGVSEEDDAFGEGGAFEEGEQDKYANLEPSQRRAAERAERRLRSRLSRSAA